MTAPTLMFVEALDMVLGQMRDADFNFSSVSVASTPAQLINSCADVLCGIATPFRAPTITTATPYGTRVPCFAVDLVSDSPPPPSKLGGSRLTHDGVDKLPRGE